MSMFNHNNVNHILPQHSPTTFSHQLMDSLDWYNWCSRKRNEYRSAATWTTKFVQNPSFRLWLKHPFLGRRIRKSRPSTLLWTPLQLQLWSRLLSFCTWRKWLRIPLFVVIPMWVCLKNEGKKIWWIISLPHVTYEEWPDSGKSTSFSHPQYLGTLAKMRVQHDQVVLSSMAMGSKWSTPKMDGFPTKHDH